MQATARAVLLCVAIATAAHAQNVVSTEATFEASLGKDELKAREEHERLWVSSALDLVVEK